MAFEAPTHRPHTCGLCSDAKIERRYELATKTGLVPRVVMLCQRCDLSPTPPPRPASYRG